MSRFFETGGWLAKHDNPPLVVLEIEGEDYFIRLNLTYDEAERVRKTIKSLLPS